MAIEDEFCTLSELADSMVAAVVAKYALPLGEVFISIGASDGKLESMDASESIRIVSRQNAVLEICCLIDQGEISPLNMSLLPAVQPVPYRVLRPPNHPPRTGCADTATHVWPGTNTAASRRSANTAPGRSTCAAP